MEEDGEFKTCLYNRTDGIVRETDKSNTLTTKIDRDCNKKHNSAGVLVGGKLRKLKPVECERLQTLPDNYTEGLSNSRRYKLIGNSWTVDVIAHIFSFIPENHLPVVVSLFDGISCGQLALLRVNKSFEKYYASEVDKFAIKVTSKNFPNTIHLGDVLKINWDTFMEKL